MQPLRVLIYIEPVSFRDNPTLLYPWVEWLSAMVNSQDKEALKLSYGLIGSKVICDLFREKSGTNLDEIYFCRQRELLASFNFNRGAYARDLFEIDAAPFENTGLIEFLQFVQYSYNPNIVISFTENKYLRNVFTEARFLFCELAPLPRLTAKRQFLFTDPIGHQSKSLISLAAKDDSLSVHDASGLMDVYTEYMFKQASEHPLISNISGWIKEYCGNSKIALIALQPSDWITYDGSYESIPMESILMRCLNELPSDWIAIPSYHPASKLSRATEESIAHEFCNVRFAPHELSFGLSELFLPYIDAVITVSSSVAVSALIMGKVVISLGTAPFKELCTRDIKGIASAIPLDAAARTRILALLSHNYCHSLPDVMNSKNFFGNFLRKYFDEPNPIDLFCKWPANLKEQLSIILTNSSYSSQHNG